MLGGGRLEFEPEIDRRIGKSGDRGERNFQSLRSALKAEIDRKRVVADFERPELVLQHDRHLVRKFAEQMVRDPHPGGASAKSDIEVMVSR